MKPFAATAVLGAACFVVSFGCGGDSTPQSDVPSSGSGASAGMAAPASPAPNAGGAPGGAPVAGRGMMQGSTEPSAAGATSSDPMTSAGASGAPPAAPAGSGDVMAMAGAGGDAAPAMPADAAAADPSPGCSGGTLMPGESTQMLDSGGASRLYVQHVPAIYDGTKPVPLLLDLHGGSYDGPRWVGASGFDKIADEENFIIVYPSGTENSWLATEMVSADGQFLRDLIKALGDQGCIDRKRVYSTGCSMGGAMSFWMGCHASDLIAAIAPMCGTPFFALEECKPAHPLPMMLTIGETDGLNCWEGMPGSVGNPCAKQVLAAFKDINSCQGEFKSTHEGACETYDQCAEGSEVTICKSNTGHGVYQATNLEVTPESWKFLKRFYLH